jgi:hypothetical protein
VPAGRSKTTDHDEIVDVPPFVIVYLPSQPEPQSEVFVKTAVGVAADAAGANQIAATPAVRAIARVMSRALERDTATSHGQLPNY